MSAGTAGQATALPTTARVVIVGGGITGCSIAYHLTKRGWSDVIVLERKTLGCGTTWHAPGLVGLLRPTLNMTRLALHTNSVLPELEKETGLSTGFKQNGSIIVTANRDLHEQFQRLSKTVGVVGLDLHEISVAEAAQRWPLANTEDLVGAFAMPSEGQTNPLDTLQAYARGARLGGAKIIENVSVDEVVIRNGAVKGVRTKHGDIAAEYVVNCTGMWSREVGKGSGVPVPVHAVEANYIVTEPIEGAAADMPILRDTQNGISTRADAGQLTIGFMSPVGEKPWGMDGIPADFSFDELPNDHDLMEVMIERILQRVPDLENVGVRTFFTGPEGVSSDAKYHLGEVPNVRNYMVAAGMSHMGIGSSGGIGRTMAEIIVDGEPSIDLWEVDPRRAMPFESNKTYLHDRVGEAGAALYDLFWPFYQPKTARGIRRSPLHNALLSAGAFFEVTAGWERPGWYFPTGSVPEFKYTYDRQAYADMVEAEYKSLDTGVGLCDLSSYTKIILQGQNLAQKLEGLCANFVSVGTDRTVQSPLLNANGSIEAFVNLHWLGDNRCLMTSETSSQSKLLAWLTDFFSDDPETFVTDVTSGYALIAVIGSKASSLLDEISAPQFDASAVVLGESRVIDAGYGHARLSKPMDLQVPYWEMLVPTEFAASLYETCVEKGAPLNIRNIGAKVYRTLLVETSNFEWGEALARAKSPLTVGLGSLVAVAKPDHFVGRDAFIAALKTGTHRQLVTLTLEESDPILFGSEPILRNGQAVGHVLEGYYANRFGGGLAIGFIEADQPITEAYLASAKFEIELAGKVRPAALLGCTSSWADLPELRVQNA